MSAGSLTVRSLNFKNRVVMAPLTRSRGGPGNVPHVLNALYYAQRQPDHLRGDANLQRARVTFQHQAFTAPHRSTAGEQVTKAVHIAGGCTVLKFWHVGCISHASAGRSIASGVLAIKPNARGSRKASNGGRRGWY
jgi:N-ethylmaleimide reductase